MIFSGVNEQLAENLSAVIVLAQILISKFAKSRKMASNQLPLKQFRKIPFIQLFKYKYEDMILKHNI